MIPLCLECKKAIRFIGLIGGWIHEPRLEEYFHVAVGPTP